MPSLTAVSVFCIEQCEREKALRHRISAECRCNAPTERRRNGWKLQKRSGAEPAVSPFRRANEDAVHGFEDREGSDFFARTLFRNTKGRRISAASLYS